MKITNQTENDAPIEQLNEEFFHARTQFIEIGAVLNCTTRPIKPEKQWIENEFERFRDGRSISRLTAFFATATVADCLYYHNIQTDYALAFLYKVKMSSPNRHPMALIGKAEKHQGNSECLKAIVEEYWQPTKNWQFWEFLDASMEIIEGVEPPSNEMVAGAKFRYDEDRRLVNALWPTQSQLASDFMKLRDY